jgi:hypothetical protein
MERTGVNQNIDPNEIRQADLNRDRHPRFTTTAITFANRQLPDRPKGREAAICLEARQPRDADAREMTVATLDVDWLAPRRRCVPRRAMAVGRCAISKPIDAAFA